MKISYQTPKKNLIGGIYKVNKDNKEILDYTLQIEAVATSRYYHHS